MKKLVCNYAPVRFLPYRETGEFVNLGVITHFPENGIFDFRLIKPKKHKRVTDFFPELDVKILRAALIGLTAELTQVCENYKGSDLRSTTTKEDAAFQIKLFREVTRKREGLLHFGDVGTLLVDSTEEALIDLFGRFVERQFAQKREYQETVMKKRLANYLKKWNLDAMYEKDRQIGDDDFHVVMPFVHYNGHLPSRVIRPLDLAKEEPSDIFDHGGTWVARMARLLERKCLPEKSIFAVSLPTEEKQLKAAQQICAELEKLGVQSVPLSDEERVHKAASFN